MIIIYMSRIYRSVSSHRLPRREMSSMTPVCKRPMMPSTARHESNSSNNKLARLGLNATATSCRQAETRNGDPWHHFTGRADRGETNVNICERREVKFIGAIKRAQQEIEMASKRHNRRVMKMSIAFSRREALCRVSNARRATSDCDACASDIDATAYWLSANSNDESVC